MATNLKQNTIHVNTFAKGMNTDASYDQISNEQYLFGKNLRITNSAFLGKSSTSTDSKGVVSPVADGIETLSNVGNMFNNKKILATGSIENVGYVITRDDVPESTWQVYKAEYNDGSITFTKQFESNTTTNRDKFSTVINKETEKVLKLYIADGEHLIMLLNLLANEYNQGISGNINYLMSYRMYPSVKPYIMRTISGKMPTCQVQYVYRLYKKYGICSKLSPITNKILIIDNNRNKEEGNAANTTTSIGLEIAIPLSELKDDQKGFCEIFDHVLLYRLVYKKPGENCEIHLIYDNKIYDEDKVTIYDAYSDPLEVLSIDDFLALDSLQLVPDSIEFNLDHMFIANVNDVTMLNLKENTLEQIDSRAYRRNSKGHFEQYSNSQYTESLIYDSVEEIPDDYYLDKASDLSYSLNDLNNNSKTQYALSNGEYLYGAEGKNVSYLLVTTDVCVHENVDLVITNGGITPPFVSNTSLLAGIVTHKLGRDDQDSIGTVKDYLNQHNVYASLSLDYSDIICSSMLRSLKRDEVYRYGIIYYDKYGTRSDVQWIGDVRTPTVKELPNFSNTFYSDSMENMELIRLDEFKINGGDYLNSYFLQNGSYSMLCQGSVAKVGTIYTYETWSAQYLGSGKPFTKVIGKYDKNNVIEIRDLQVTVTPISPFNAFLKGDPVTIEELNDEWKYGSVSYDVALDVDGEEYLIGDKVRLYSDSTVSLKCNKALIFNKNFNLGDRSDAYGITHMFPPQFYLKYNNTLPDVTITLTQDTCTLGYIVEVSCKVNVYKSSAPELEHRLLSRPIGIKFDVNVPQESGIESFQIVRCAKTREFTRNITQCALGRPCTQTYTYNTADPFANGVYSPWYPFPFLSTSYVKFLGDDGTNIMNASNYGHNSNTIKGYDLIFQLHSPEINLFLDSVSRLIQQNKSNIQAIATAYMFGDPKSYMGDNKGKVFQNNTNSPRLTFNRERTRGSGMFIAGDAIGNSQHSTANYKTSASSVILMYNTLYDFITDKANVSKIAEIDAVSTTEAPTWNSGFTSIQHSGSVIVSGVKAYKSYVSAVLNLQYVNWVCNGMYDLRITDQESSLNNYGEAGFAARAFTYINKGTNGVDTGIYRLPLASGWVGPGPRCLISKLNNDGKETVYNNEIYINNEKQTTILTLICNIVHKPTQFAGYTKHDHLYDVYYGFGNYGKLESDGNGNMIGSLTVFDGDVYNMPCEIISMYKTYNMNSIYDTIPSTLIVNYVPMETKINVFFDYGMNYMNTKSPNIQSLPGEITGISVQERPPYQYNDIYSDNNSSNDIYQAQSLEDVEEHYPQRIYYSDHKTNGEVIDNFVKFKTLNTISVDSRYGDITSLYTNKDILYFWLNFAFGRLSVNERSLITDTNSNTIQLGTGGVVQKADYVDTQHGMRYHDYSSISVNNEIYWIDIANNTILKSNGTESIDLAVQYGVLNLFKRITSDVPYIHYDVENKEILCKCINGDQVVINSALQCVTSLYTRLYDDIISFNNVLFGINNSNVLKFTNVNIDDENNGQVNYLNPLELTFLVNPVASVTKTFDTQQICTQCDYNEDITDDYMSGKSFTYSTNLNLSANNTEDMQLFTNVEGNIQYSIPRANQAEYGGRMRGRWMKIDIVDNSPNPKDSISHIITKYRQSFN